MQLTPSEEHALDAEHIRCLAVAAAVFDDIAVGDASIRTAHQHKFREACQARCVQQAAAGCMWGFLPGTEDVSAATALQCFSTGACLVQAVSSCWHAGCCVRRRCCVPCAAGCRFTQVRARKLAEAVAAVNELLMQANGLVNTALAVPDATASQLDELVSQVRQGASWAQC